MNLEDIPIYARTLEDLATAIKDVDPKIAAEALRTVQRAVSGPEIEVESAVIEPSQQKLISAGPVLAQAASDIVAGQAVVVPVDLEWLADKVATAIVGRHGWGYTAARAAADAVIEELGAEKPIEDLIAAAHNRGATFDEQQDKNGRPKSKHARGIGTVKAKGKSAQHAADYVKRHKKVKTRDYAAAAGIEMSAAQYRLKAAERAGLIVGEGETTARVWTPAKEAA